MRFRNNFELCEGSEKIMRGKLLKIAVILFCIISVFCVFAGIEKLEVYAKDAPNGSYLSGDVKELKEKRNGYVMQITVENKGESGEVFNGTVQVIFETPVHSVSGYIYNSVNCAYNTEITLSAQEKKQFTITLTDFTVEHSFENGQGKCALNFIDEGGNVIRSISFYKVFNDYPGKYISVGVLSDNIEGLNHMNINSTIRVYNSYASNSKLIRLNNDNIKEQLDELYFLIIDQFNVSLLNEEDIQAIQDWVKSGGWLIIGTGEYAEQTLSGFDKDFLNVDVLSISEPGEENILTARPESYYSEYDGIDFTKMAVADLNDNSTNGYFYISISNPAICSSIGDGAVMIFNVSLGENELRKFNKSDNIYFEAAGNGHPARRHYFEDYSNISERLLASMDRADFMYRDDFVCGGDFEVSSAERNLALICFFGGLLIIIIVYGIQRKYTVRKWYWICGYVFGLIMLSISGIMFFIQNTALEKDNVQANVVQANNVLEKESRVYSVTTQRVDGNRADTYLLAYRDDTNLWKIRLKDNYYMASPGTSENKLINNSYGPQTDDYYYIVSNNNEGLSVGIKPGKDNSGFFYAEGSTESKGTIFCKDFISKSDVTSRNDMGITITNGTDYDMAYMAIFKQRSYIMIFSDVKAGETLNLKQAIKDGRCVYEDDYFRYEKQYDDIMVRIFEQSSNGEYEYESDDIAALLVGIGIAENERPRELKRAAIVGLVKDYDKVIGDECNETSYGCFYTYAQQEEDLVGDDAEESDDNLESAAVTNCNREEQANPCDYYEDLIAAARECIEGNVVEKIANEGSGGALISGWHIISLKEQNLI